jgi:hypothetical protein
METVAMWLCGCDSEMTAAERSAWETTGLPRAVVHCCPLHGTTTLARASTPYPELPGT